MRFIHWGQSGTEMKEQTGLACSAFVLLHITVAANVIAIATPYWVSNDTGNFTTKVANYTSQGLWTICAFGKTSVDCQKFKLKQSAWLIAVQVLYTIGTCLTVLALFGYYSLFGIEHIEHIKMVSISTINSFTIAALKIGGILIIIGIALFSKWGRIDTTITPPTHFSWSYDTAAGGAVTTIVTAVVLSHKQCQLQKQRLAYGDI